MMRSKAKLVKLTVLAAVCVLALIACKSTQQNLNQPPAQPPPAPAPAQPVGFVKEAEFIAPGKKSTYDHFRDGHLQLTNCAGDASASPPASSPPAPAATK